MSLTLVTPPAAAVVSTADLKTHLRISHSDEDTYLDTLVEVATAEVEKFTGRKLITQTWDWRLDAFPHEFAVPFAPLQSVTSITYTDTDGDSQTLASSVYTVDIYTSPARIVEAYGQSWPSTRDIINAVTVRYVCGYGAAGSNVPDPLVHALKMIAGHLYENRELLITGVAGEKVPMAAEYMMWPYRVMA